MIAAIAEEGEREGQEEVRGGEERFKKKAEVDVEDLKWCLATAQGMWAKGQVGMRSEAMTKGVWSDRNMFDEEFEELSRGRVRDFCQRFPMMSGMWRGVGFDV